MDSIPSSYSSSDGQGICWMFILVSNTFISPFFIIIDLQDNTPDEQEEKARLITQVLELQNTLDGKISLISTALATKLQTFFLSQTSHNEWTVSKRKIWN